ncbi:putative heme iron utilization protein [Opitutaceae bacterium TAV1]|nr:putative heme iron utilization protein [Opitutaceae bacterium TAV1]
MTTTATAPHPSAEPFFKPEHLDRILGHMNEDHASANLGYVRHYGNLPEATAATLTGIDQNGIYLDATLPSGEVRAIFIGFAKPLSSPADAHPVLVDMAIAAATALGAAVPQVPGHTAGAAHASAPVRPAGGDAFGRAREAAAFLRENFKTVILGTVSAEGEPDASVAPAVFVDGSFYVYISGLSHHTHNIRATKRASVFLIEDESSARQLLARRRLTFASSAAPVARDAGRFTEILPVLKEKFGPVMEHLETMVDFELFQLTPERGRLVAGFGQAYEVNPADWTQLSHVNDVGHAVRKG